MTGNNASLFNSIATVYGWFFMHQLKKFRTLLAADSFPLDLAVYDSAIDVGCGTGALCRALTEQGLDIQCVDHAEKMLNVAKNIRGNDHLSFSYGDALVGLSFPDKTFDLAFATHVAHGLEADDRSMLYRELARVAKHYVVLYDFIDSKSTLISFIERLEGSDYQRFIKVAPDELRTFFSEVQILKVGKNSGWYVCKIKD